MRAYRIALRQGVQIKPHLIVSRLEAGEGVVTVRIGRGGVHFVALGIEQGHVDIGDAGLVVLLNAVGVGVVPDGVSEGGRLIKPEVHGHVGIVVILRRSCCTGEACLIDRFRIGLEIVVRRADAIAFVIITIFITVIIGSIIVALTCTRLHTLERSTCGKLTRRYVHKIAPGDHIVKDITTVRLRLRRSDRGGCAWSITGMIELQCHAGDTGLVAILDSIVGHASSVSIVIPNDITDCNRGREPEVQSMIVLSIVAGRVVDGRISGVQSAIVSIAIMHVIRGVVDILRGGDTVSKMRIVKCNTHLIVCVGFQWRPATPNHSIVCRATEVIFPGRVSRGLAYLFPCPRSRLLIEINRYVTQRRLARILDPVTICIFPNIVTDFQRCRRKQQLNIPQS